MVRTRGMERAALGAAALYVVTQWQRQQRMDAWYSRLAYWYAGVYAIRALAAALIRDDQVWEGHYDVPRHYGPGMEEGYYQRGRFNELYQ